MFKSKGGVIHYSIIFSLIIGLLIVAIVSSWLFSDYFSKEEIDWQVCREAIILRNTLPEKDAGGVEVLSAKEALPLECRTQVIDIDYEDTEQAEKEISEVIAGCWYMVGRGEYKIFPGRSTRQSIETPCMMCARIGLEPEVREYYSEEDNRIDLKRALNQELEGYGRSVWDYLNPLNEVNAFTYFDDWDPDGFNHSFVRDWSWSGFDPKESEIFSLPRYFIPERGDLFVAYAEPVREQKSSGERSIDPYMIILQQDDFDKLTNRWAKLKEGLMNIYVENVVPPLLVLNLVRRGCEDCVQICSEIASIPA